MRGVPNRDDRSLDAGNPTAARELPSPTRARADVHGLTPRRRGSPGPRHLPVHGGPERRSHVGDCSAGRTRRERTPVISGPRRSQRHGWNSVQVQGRPERCHERSDGMASAKSVPESRFTCPPCRWWRTGSAGLRRPPAARGRSASHRPRRSHAPCAAPLAPGGPPANDHGRFHRSRPLPTNR